jgi:Snf7
MKSMNRGLNLPQIQRIMNEFERESATMDMKEEMMSDAVDDVMDDELEDEEEESDKILRQVLDEIGVGISQQVRLIALHLSCHISTHPQSCPAGRRTYGLGYHLNSNRATTCRSCRWSCSSTWNHQLWKWQWRRKHDGRRCLTSAPRCPSSRIDLF